MAVTIPNCSWSPRRDPHQGQDRHTGNTVCQESTMSVNVGVPETAATLTRTKSASSVRELPPP